MAKKFIEFLEAAALIILTGVIVVGVIKYVDSKGESKEDDPIVDVEPTKSISISGPATLKLTFEYYEGMTWEEAIESNESLSEVLSIDENGYVKVHYVSYGITYFISTYGNASADDCIKGDLLVDLTISSYTSVQL